MTLVSSISETKCPPSARQRIDESTRPPSNVSAAKRRTMFANPKKQLGEAQISAVSVDIERSAASRPYGVGHLSPMTPMTPSSPRPPAPLSKPSCTCQCSCGSASGKVPSTVKRKDEMKSQNLSWRRLELCKSKLKVSATTSELLAGFALVAMVELNINDPTIVPEWLFVVFSVCTTVLVSVHIFALMISTYILPNIDAVSQLHLKSLVGDSPHEQMRLFIELAWCCSTVLGLFLFLFDVIVICWIQFLDFSFTAALSGTIILGPMLIVFVGIVLHFYMNLNSYTRKICEVSETDENITLNFSQA